ncbi:hypothetical protein [Salininema proteolyticum]|uniref:Uncharacterized protein n=1 Tax=Salininema proteolyticum TaxID=1607685 RepID=A0ABV8U4U2_9ACTN
METSLIIPGAFVLVSLPVYICMRSSSLGKWHWTAIVALPLIGLVLMVWFLDPMMSLSIPLIYIFIRFSIWPTERSTV